MSQNHQNEWPHKEGDTYCNKIKKVNKANLCDYGDPGIAEAVEAYLMTPGKAIANYIKTGVKYDEDKVRMDLIPPELLTAVASILTFGAAKYSARNWEQGMDWGRIYGALQRHLNAWWGGENTDSETGKSHLWHAGCCLAFLITYEQRRVGVDDRPKIGAGSGDIINGSNTDGC